MRKYVILGQVKKYDKKICYADINFLHNYEAAYLFKFKF